MTRSLRRVRCLACCSPGTHHTKALKKLFPLLRNKGDSVHAEDDLSNSIYFYIDSTSITIRKANLTYRPVLAQRRKKGRSEGGELRGGGRRPLLDRISRSTWFFKGSKQRKPVPGGSF
ncbi:hypothetical protein OIU78_014703 [Salix suchowensis]|nr:hypothetical protein OIU78_014703 [Salix suchowensis]